jgi:hypothetical protein
MNLKTVIVDLDSIKTPSCKGSTTEIEALANTIVQLRGLVSLPVIRKLAIDEYELISGELEFHAYVQAQAMDDSLPDRIMAFLADEQSTGPIVRQQEVLRTITGVSQTTTKTDTNSSLDVSNLAAQIDRLSQSQSQSFTALQSAVISAIQDTIPQPLPLLAAMNRIQEPKVALQVRSKLAFLGDKKVQKIIQLLQTARQQGQEFQSCADIQKVLVEIRNQKPVKLIGDKKMLEIIDRWH